jgi:hypothetical protein
LWLAIKGFLRFTRCRALCPRFLSFLPQLVIRVLPAAVRADFAIKDMSFRTYPRATIRAQKLAQVVLFYLHVALRT